MADLASIEDFRRRAMAHRAAPLPDRSAHLWRYTDPRHLLPDVDLLTRTALAVELPDEARSAGVRALPIDAERNSPKLGVLVPWDHGPLEALNGAYFGDGLRLQVPAGVTLDAPIRLHVNAPAHAQSVPRLLLDIGRAAVVTVVEEHTGGSGGRIASVTELHVGDAAQVRHVILQAWDGTARGHLTSRATLGRDANLVTAVTSFGGDRVKMDLGAILAGPGARSEMLGFALGEGAQHLDHHTIHEHTAPDTWSNLEFKAVLGDQARSTYTGRIRITQGAPRSEAYQENRNLLLGAEARADTVPELEILTDDVMCSHGATVAPVEEEPIFYLQSRGLDREAATRLVVRGFLESTLRRLPEALLEKVEAVIDERLARLGDGR